VIVAGLLRTRRMNFGGDPSTTGVRRPPNSRDGARRDAAFQKGRWSPCAFLTQLVDRELNSGWYLRRFTWYLAMFGWYLAMFGWYLVSSTILIPHTPSPWVSLPFVVHHSSVA